MHPDAKLTELISYFAAECEGFVGIISGDEAEINDDITAYAAKKSVEKKYPLLVLEIGDEWDLKGQEDMKFWTLYCSIKVVVNANGRVKEARNKATELLLQMLTRMNIQDHYDHEHIFILLDQEMRTIPLMTNSSLYGREMSFIYQTAAKLNE